MFSSHCCRQISRKRGQLHLEKKLYLCVQGLRDMFLMTLCTQPNLCLDQTMSGFNCVIILFNVNGVAPMVAKNSPIWDSQGLKGGTNCCEWRKKITLKDVNFIRRLFYIDLLTVFWLCLRVFLSARCASRKGKGEEGTWTPVKRSKIRSRQTCKTYLRI